MADNQWRVMMRMPDGVTSTLTAREFRAWLSRADDDERHVSPPEAPISLRERLAAERDAANTHEEPTADRYRVCWSNEATGAEGHGAPRSKAEAIAWAEQLNREYPEFHHWAERVDDPGEPDAANAAVAREAG